MLRIVAVALGAVLGAGLCHAQALKKEPLTADAINSAQMTPAKGEEPNAGILRAQVLLDRVGFSPGVIDARGGQNFKKALTAYQTASGLGVTGNLDEETWKRLTDHASDVVVAYTISPTDLKGPFVKEIPKDYRKMAGLKHLGYRGPREALSEKFHMDEDLLALLNPSADFEAEGTRILVADVTRKASEKPRKTVKVLVDKTEASVRAFAADGTLLAYFPASVGSKDKPAPSGRFEVRAVAQNPPYRYDPEFNFKGQKAKEAVEIAPGPNGPVGAVWIALSARTFGIHGTPEPDKVSKTASHGCIRLTNWDALALSRMVSRGTVVEMR